MESIVQQIQVALEEQDIEAVYQLYHQFFESFEKEKNFDQMIELADYSQFIGYLEEAKRAYQILAQEDPSDSVWTILLAELLVQEGSNDQALSILYDIPQTDPNFGPSLMLQAALYTEEGSYEVAKKKLFQARELLEDKAGVDLQLGMLAFDLEDYETAILHLESYKKQVDPSDEDWDRANDLLDQANFQLGQSQLFKDDLSDQTLETLSPSFLDRMGQTFLLSEDYDKAERVFSFLLDRDPDHLEALMGYGQALLALTKLSQAREVFLQLTQVLPLDPTSRRYLALTYVLDNNTQEALYQYEKALETAEGGEALEEEYAYLLLSSDQTGKLLDWLQELEKDRDLSYSLAYCGAQAAQEEEDYDLAHSYFAYAAEGLGQDLDFILDYASFLREEGKRKEALIWVNRGLDLDPLDEDLVDLAMSLGGGENEDDWTNFRD